MYWSIKKEDFNHQEIIQIYIYGWIVYSKIHNIHLEIIEILISCWL